MISKKTKDKPMMLTTHRLGAIAIAKKIEAIPEDKRTPQQKMKLTDFQTEEKGILTTHDIEGAKRESLKFQSLDTLLTPDELEAVAAFKRTIIENRAKAIAKKIADEKKAVEKKAAEDAKAAAGKGGQSVKKENKPKTNIAKK